MMRKAAELLRERADMSGRVMTQEQGKSRRSTGEVLVTADISNGSPRKAAEPMAASSRAARRTCARS